MKSVKFQSPFFIFLILAILRPDISQAQDASAAPATTATEVSDVAAAPVVKKRKKRRSRSNGDQNQTAPVQDASIENIFHQNYVKYNSEPTSDERWSGASGQVQEQYVTQSGDTLWDISSTLFADPFFWPKIWSINVGQIGNPHNIEPGTQLVFIPGTIDQAPQVETTPMAEAVPEEAESLALELSDAELSQDLGSGNKKKNKKPTKAAILPPSFPMLKLYNRGNAFGNVDISLQSREVPNRKETLTYFIADQEVISTGEVIEIEANLKSAGDFQNIYVKFNGSPKKRYIAIKKVGAVPNPFKFLAQGTAVEVQGEIEVLEQVNKEKNIYRATVTRSFVPIEVGVLLQEGVAKTFSVDAGEQPENQKISGRIIGGQFSVVRKVQGSSSLIFLDSGSKEGFKVGQLLYLYADHEVRQPGSEVQSNDRQIGFAKIVDVNESYSTAFVISANDSVEIGDYVGFKKDHQARGADDGFFRKNRSNNEASLSSLNGSNGSSAKNSSKKSDDDELFDGDDVGSESSGSSSDSASPDESLDLDESDLGESDSDSDELE